MSELPARTVWRQTALTLLLRWWVVLAALFRNPWASAVYIRRCSPRRDAQPLIAR